MFQLQFIFCSIVTNGTACFVAPPRHKFVTAGHGNDDFPWLYTQTLQNIGGAKVCIVLGK